MSVRKMPRCRSDARTCSPMLKLVTQLNLDQNGKSPGNLGPVKSFMGKSFFDQFENMRVNTKISQTVSELHTKKYKKIFPIGDVHGDLLSLLTMLHSSGIIDQHGDWCYTGLGPLLVVQLGDALDRKRSDAVEDTSDNPQEEMNIIEYMFMLSQQASESGHTFISLSGNHEHMAISGTDKYAYVAHLTPFSTSNDNTSRGEILRTLGARNYLAIFRPVVLTLPTGWIITHGLVEKAVADHVAKIKKSAEGDNELQHFMKYLNSKWAKYVRKSAPDPPANTAMWYKVMWARPEKEMCGAVTRPFMTYKGQIVGHTINDTKPNEDYQYEPTCSGIYQMDFAMSAGFSFMDQKSPPTGHFFDVNSGTV